VLLRIDSLVDKVGTTSVPVKCEVFLKHFAYPALALPQRELRSAIHDWAVRPPPIDADNLASLRYNCFDVITVSRHEGLVASDEQADWVREQASESLLVGAAIANLCHATAKEMRKRLRSRSPGSSISVADKKASISTLKARRELLQHENRELTRFETEFGSLLELIRIGTVTTYPDHTKLMTGIFRAMGFDLLQAFAQRAVQDMRQHQQRNIDELSRIYREVSMRLNKRLNHILSGALVVVSIGALDTFVDVFNEGSPIWKISGQNELLILVGAVVGVVAVLLKGANPNE
jgi:hypothetical protein